MTFFLKWTSNINTITVAKSPVLFTPMPRTSRPCTPMQYVHAHAAYIHVMHAYVMHDHAVHANAVEGINRDTLTVAIGPESDFLRSNRSRPIQLIDLASC